MFKHCLNHEKNTFYPCPPCLNFLTFADRNEDFIITEDCYAEADRGPITMGCHLWGDVRIVNNPDKADFRVLRTKPYADICVRLVKDPGECGEWRFVTKGEKFTVYFVKSERETYDFSVYIRSDDKSGLGFQHNFHHF